MTEYEIYLIKILLLGKEGVGKTSIARRYVLEKFDQSFKSTMGLDILSHVVKVDGIKYQLQIWDFGGQAVFKPIRRNFYDAANGILLIFDLTDPDSLNRAREWVKESRENLREEIPVAVAANKRDLVDEIKITDRESEEFVKESRLTGPLLKTSALKGENIQELFVKLIKETQQRQSDLDKVDLD
ncbi:MAG: Rab family GTPase [Candidatus Hodarchaeales archaeon]|jgi:small GTP-binding protein